MYKRQGGVCDGCLNWKGMGVKNPPAHTGESNYYHMDASGINETDNNGLAAIVDKLELIYTTIDWPFKVFFPKPILPFPPTGLGRVKTGYGPNICL